MGELGEVSFGLFERNTRSSLRSLRLRKYKKKVWNHDNFHERWKCWFSENWFMSVSPNLFAKMVGWQKPQNGWQLTWTNFNGSRVVANEQLLQLLNAACCIFKFSIFHAQISHHRLSNPPLLWFFGCSWLVFTKHSIINFNFIAKNPRNFNV